LMAPPPLVWHEVVRRQIPGTEIENVFKSANQILCNAAVRQGGLSPPPQAGILDCGHTRVEQRRK